jgi:hypothetical protein
LAHKDVLRYPLQGVAFGKRRCVKQNLHRLLKGGTLDHTMIDTVDTIARNRHEVSPAGHCID